MRVTIRLARPEDPEEIAATHVASWHKTCEGMVPPEMLSSLSVDARAGMWREIIHASSSDSQKVYVAEVNHRIVGFGSCGAQRTHALEPQGYDGEIGAIYVRKASQRQGIGTQLLGAMASDLTGRGYAAVSLWVLKENAPARRFYERYGAEIIAEREDARPDGILVEVGYGWTDLERLVRLLRPPGIRV